MTAANYVTAGNVASGLTGVFFDKLFTTVFFHARQKIRIDRKAASQIDWPESTFGSSTFLVLFFNRYNRTCAIYH